MGIVHNVAGYLKSGEEVLVLEKVNGDGNRHSDLIAGTREYRDRRDFKNTAARETFEETGYRPSEEEIEMFRPYIMRINPSYFHVRPFRIKLDGKPEIETSIEHEDYRWMEEDELENELDDGRYFNYRYVEAAAEGMEKLEETGREVFDQVINMQMIDSENDIDKIIRSIG